MLKPYSIIIKHIDSGIQNYLGSFSISATYYIQLAKVEYSTSLYPSFLRRKMGLIIVSTFNDYWEEKSCECRESRENKAW